MADETTPVGEPLTAKYQNSFAYTTIKDRLPVILSKIADTLCRMKDKVKAEHGEKGCNELKTIIGCMSKLRNEVQTDKTLKPIEDQRSDVTQWNDYLVEVMNLAADNESSSSSSVKDGSANVSWFTERWLYVECYMYRRVQEAVELCEVLNRLDVFQEQKQSALLSSQPAVDGLLSFLDDLLSKLGPSISDLDLQTAFKHLIQISLWSNKCDLSISAGAEMKYQFSLLETLKTLCDNILIDDTSSMWNHLEKMRHPSDHPTSARIDIILDNSAYELITDLCLAEFFVASGLATTVHFHGKAFPWFVSDTTQEDFYSTLAQLEQSTDEVAARFGQRWLKRLQDGSWHFTVHDFWTLPFTFDQMRSRCPNLYNQLAASNLIIFKGDLNYRKLVGDINWDTTTPFSDALRGFHPAPLCVLRTTKSDTVAGLNDDVKTKVSQTDAQWMVNGNWGIISFSDQIS
ncbi:damage-control phosphatase ARMT1-like [Octopus sinensis]|uniref:Sugar phosphate phosphatase n=1 Tax=Octopus sinensis TaxID=2607531 RepID=A0A6P7TVY1_9MOLL|nr:damage-control phosphatase ARMT1-like [Octopus sinensis]XP_036370868.1 damage-control phosphatase ARMT1-like [Octopus sinensis]